MNEQIKQFAKQAGFGVRQNGSEVYTSKLEHLPITENVEKFAELIIRECMRTCDVAAVGYEEHGDIKEANGCVLARKYIAEHLGVE